MRRTVRLLAIATVILAMLAFAPSAAQAQHGHGYGGVRVYVGGYWGYPYWGWGYPYWGWGWGYPYWGWGPWYGYPYYTGRPDNSAEIRLEITPKDAQVYVDGYFAGTVDDYDGLFQHLHLQPGEHEIVIYKQGFRTIKQTIRVRARQDSKIRYALQPLGPGETAEEPPPPPKQEEPARRAGPPAEPEERMPPRREPPPYAANEPQSFGTLVLRVQPAGAEVLIDGERWQGPEGEGRLSVHVAEGPHRVEIRKDGYVPFTTEVTVRAGEATPLNVSLPPRGE